MISLDSMEGSGRYPNHWEVTHLFLSASLKASGRDPLEDLLEIPSDEWMNRDEPYAMMTLMAL